MTPQDYDFIRKMLRERSGLVLSAEKQYLVESRLLPVVRKAGLASLAELVTALKAVPSSALAATVVEAFGPEGLEMCVPLLHAVLGQRGNAMLVPAETRPQPDGTVRCIAHDPLEIPPDATIQQIAQICWDWYEPIFRERPEEWLWPYKHFRYRPRGAVRKYPPYANESSKYEKLRRAAKATH